MNLQMISAISEDSSAKIKELIERGFDVNEHSRIVLPPLHRAAMYGKLNALKTLLELGADKDLKDADDKTALHWATRLNHSHIIFELLK